MALFCKARGALISIVCFMWCSRFCALLIRPSTQQFWMNVVCGTYITYGLLHQPGLRFAINVDPAMMQVRVTCVVRSHGYRALLRDAERVVVCRCTQQERPKALGAFRSMALPRLSPVCCMTTVSRVRMIYSSLVWCESNAGAPLRASMPVCRH